MLRDRFQKGRLLLTEQRRTINYFKCIRGQFFVVDRSVLSDMDLRILEERYMSLPLIYATKIGIWPNQPVSQQRYQCTLVYSVLIAATFTQVCYI